MSLAMRPKIGLRDLRGGEHPPRLSPSCRHQLPRLALARGVTVAEACDGRRGRPNGANSAATSGILPVYRRRQRRQSGAGVPGRLRLATAKPAIDPSVGWSINQNHESKSDARSSRLCGPPAVRIAYGDRERARSLVLDSGSRLRQLQLRLGCSVPQSGVSSRRVLHAAGANG